MSQMEPQPTYSMESAYARGLRLASIVNESHQAGAARSAELPSAAILPEQMAVIASARRKSCKISRAAGVAAFSGWTCAVFAGFTLLSGLFSLPAFLLGMGLAVCAHIELRGGNALRRFDLAAPRRLALNQLALAIIIIVYAGWCIFESLHSPSMYKEYLDAGGDLAQTLQPIARLQMVVTIGFYVAVIVCSVIAQGSMAAYYATRRGHIDAYLRGTPAWAVDTLRAAAA